MSSLYFKVAHSSAHLVAPRFPVSALPFRFMSLFIEVISGKLGRKRTLIVFTVIFTIGAVCNDIHFFSSELNTWIDFNHGRE